MVLGLFPFRLCNRFTAAASVAFFVWFLSVWLWPEGARGTHRHLPPAEQMALTALADDGLPFLPPYR